MARDLTPMACPVGCQSACGLKAPSPISPEALNGGYSGDYIWSSPVNFIP